MENNTSNYELTRRNELNAKLRFAEDLLRKNPNFSQYRLQKLIKDHFGSSVDNRALRMLVVTTPGRTAKFKTPPYWRRHGFEKYAPTPTTPTTPTPTTPTPTTPTTPTPTPTPTPTEGEAEVKRGRTVKKFLVRYTSNGRTYHEPVFGEKNLKPVLARILASGVAVKDIELYQPIALKLKTHVEVVW